MCHTTRYVSSYYYICFRILLYMSPHTTVCGLILVERTHLQTYVNNVASQVLLCMCLHTIICVLILLHLCRSSQVLLYVCPHTNNICVLILAEIRARTCRSMSTMSPQRVKIRGYKCDVVTDYNMHLQILIILRETLFSI